VEPYISEGRHYCHLSNAEDKKLIPVQWMSRPSHPISTTMSAPSIKSKDIYEEALPTDSDELQLVKLRCL
jgi:hypothetical protein